MSSKILFQITKILISFHIRQSIVKHVSVFEFKLFVFKQVVILAFVLMCLNGLIFVCYFLRTSCIIYMLKWPNL